MISNQTTTVPRLHVLVIVGAIIVLCAVPRAGAQGPLPPQQRISDNALRSLPARRLSSTGGLRISDDTLEFGNIAAGCLQPNGQIVALSTTPATLFVVERNAGPSLRTIGRKGDGPGEFRQPWAVSCFAKDSVAVLEAARVTLVSTASGASTTLATQAFEGGSWVEMVARLAGDAYLLRRHPPGRSVTLGTFRDTLELVLAHSPRGAAQSTLLARAAQAEAVRVRSGGGLTTSLHPFARTSLIASSATEIYVMDTGTGDMQTFDTRGQLISRAHFSLTPRKITSAMQRAFRQSRLRSARSAPAREIAQAVIDQTTMQPTIPLFDRIVALSAGGVLLREFVVSEDTSTRWIELDRTLRPRAVLHLPTSLRLLAADTLSILGVVSGDDGTEIVHLPLLNGPRGR